MSVQIVFTRIHPFDMRLLGVLIVFGYAWSSGAHAGITTLASNVQNSTAPQVVLDYATYEGTARSSGVNEFLGMRFAGPDLLHESNR